MNRQWIGHFCVVGHQPFYVGTVLAPDKNEARTELLALLSECGLQPVGEWQDLHIYPGVMHVFNEQESRAISTLQSTKPK